MLSEFLVLLSCSVTTTVEMQKIPKVHGVSFFNNFTIPWQIIVGDLKPFSPVEAENDVNVYIGQSINLFYLYVVPFSIWSIDEDPERTVSGVPFYDSLGHFTQSKNPWRSAVWLSSGCLLRLIQCVGLMMEVDFTGAKEHDLLRTWEE